MVLPSLVVGRLGYMHPNDDWIREIFRVSWTARIVLLKLLEWKKWQRRNQMASESFVGFLSLGAPGLLVTCIGTTIQCVYLKCHTYYIHYIFDCMRVYRDVCVCEMMMCSLQGATRNVSK